MQGTQFDHYVEMKAYLFKAIDDTQSNIRAYDTKASFLLAITSALMSFMTISIVNIIKNYNNYFPGTLELPKISLLISILCLIVLLYALFLWLLLNLLNTLQPKNSPKITGIDDYDTTLKLKLGTFYITNDFNIINLSKKIKSFDNTSEILLCLEYELLKLSSIRQSKYDSMCDAIEKAKIIVWLLIAIFAIMFIYFIS